METPYRRDTWRQLAGRWLVLLLLSAFTFQLWAAADLPAGLLIGPMVAGIVSAALGLRLTVHRRPYQAAQIVIGAMVATSISPNVIATYARHWLLLTALTGAILLGAASLSWLATRFRLLPGTTASYGISPGAATTMVIQGEAMGADVRLVALMQYSRVVMVALAAAMAARHWNGSPLQPAAQVSSWLAPVDWLHLVLVLAVGLVGQQGARLLRIPAWTVLGPLVLLSVLHGGGWLSIQLPRWLLAVAYAVLGWHIGLDFRPDLLRQALRSLPVILGAAVILIAYCWALAILLAHASGIDMLTAYLATSPGGFDTVAIIASSSVNVDLPLILSVQCVRMFLVIAFSPGLARLMARATARRSSAHRQ